MYRGWVIAYSCIRDLYGGGMIKLYFPGWVWARRVLSRFRELPGMHIWEFGIWIKWNIRIVFICQRLRKGLKRRLESRSTRSTPRMPNRSQKLNPNPQPSNNRNNNNHPTRPKMQSINNQYNKSNKTPILQLTTSPPPTSNPSTNQSPSVTSISTAITAAPRTTDTAARMSTSNAASHG